MVMRKQRALVGDMARAKRDKRTLKRVYIVLWDYA